VGRGFLLMFAALYTGALLAMPAEAAAPPEPGPPATPAAAPAENPPFLISEYRVIGNTVLPVRAVESAVYGYLGPGRTIKDVEAARQALEDAYHKAGFGTVFVDIPEQEVQDGVVRLRVSKGVLRTVRVTGAHYFSGRQILAEVPAATAGTVPNLPALQNELAQVNAQSPDRQVVPVLKAGPDPGTVDLGLKVADKLPLHGSIELNNQNTPDTKPLRAVGALSYDDMFGNMDSLSLQYQWAPQQAGEYGLTVASYTARLNESGTKLSFMYIDSSSDISTIGALAVLGKGRILGARLSQTLDTTANSAQTLTAGVDYKDFNQNIVVAPTDTVFTPIKYLNFSLAYSGVWRPDPYQWNIDTSLNFGARGLVNHDDEFENNRFDATGDYMYLRSSASFGVRLPADFTLILRASGQYTASPLISNEQFTIGGVATVRGYLEAEELGDMGVATTLQLGTPVWQLFAKRLSVDGFVFSDFGRVSLIEALPGEPEDHELRSVGAGLHTELIDHMTGGLTWAYPLVAAQTAAREGRILFFVRGYW
jgi:hemolysin activation/secretion protein